MLVLGYHRSWKTALNSTADSNGAEETQANNPGKLTEVQMAVRAHLGWRACPSILSDFCADASSACAIVDLRALVHRLRAQTVYVIYIIVYLSTCEGNRLRFSLFFFFFFGSNICTSMGQNWPPAWLACLREERQAHAIANVSRSAAPSTAHRRRAARKQDTSRDPAGPVGWITKEDLWADDLRQPC